MPGTSFVVTKPDTVGSLDSSRIVWLHTMTVTHYVLCHRVLVVEGTGLSQAPEVWQYSQVPGHHTRCGEVLSVKARAVIVFASCFHQAPLPLVISNAKT